MLKLCTIYIKVLYIYSIIYIIMYYILYYIYIKYSFVDDIYLVELKDATWFSRYDAWLTTNSKPIRTTNASASDHQLGDISHYHSRRCIEGPSRGGRMDDGLWSHVRYCCGARRSNTAYREWSFDGALALSRREETAHLCRMGRRV